MFKIRNGQIHEIEASGFINGHGLPSRSNDVTFTFGVEDTGQPPAPPGAAAPPLGPVALSSGTISQPGTLSERCPVAG